VVARLLVPALVATALAVASPLSAAAASNPAADDFERANGPLGSSWTSDRGTWSIASGAALASNATGNAVATYNVLPIAVDYAVSARINLVTTGTPNGMEWAGVAGNVQGTTASNLSHYLLRVTTGSGTGTNGRWQLLRMTNSTTTGSPLASGTIVAAYGTQLDLTLTRTGNSLRSQVVNATSGATLADHTYTAADPNVTGGRAGLYSNSGNLRAHSWSLSTSIPAADDFERADGGLGSSWASNRGTWSIASGAALASSATNNSVATYTPLALGDDYTVSARIDIVATGTPGGSEWVGVVGNLQGTTASTLNYYVLRVTTGSGTGTNGRWQLLRMTNSTSTGLLTSGTIVAAYGTQLDLALTRTGNSLRSQVVNATSGATLADQTYTAPVVDPVVIGGRAGLYSNSGNLRAQTWSLSTTTPAATPPGALDCAPGGESYTYPDPDLTVVSTSTVATTWAGMPVGQRVLTDGTDQYVAYYDVNRGMTVAKRTIGGAWTYKTLPSTLGWDSHNYISIGLDRDGNLHVSGNMHNVPLVYFRTSTPGDISTLVKVNNMVSTSTETSVTYPEFVNRSDGSLVFSHRSGGSGDGVTYFNAYDEATSSWSRLVSEPLFDGDGSASNPSGTWSSYFQGPTKGPDGWFHMLWVWRDSANAATNSILTYAKSQDLVNWVTNNGTPLTTPFTYGQGDVVDPVPDFGGLLNGNAKIGFDGAGNVLITYHKYDAQARSQVYAARPTGTGTWQIRQITNWTGRWSFGGVGSLDFRVAMQGSHVLSNGDISVNLFCDGSGNKQSIIIDSSLNRIAQVPSQPLPASVTTVNGTFPGLQVNIASDLAGATAGGEYILRWEALPHNADQPRSSYPTGGSTLEVILLD
jgi:hypothetical protein